MIRKHMFETVVCLFVILGFGVCDKEGPSGPTDEDVIGTWVATFMSGQTTLKSTIVIRADDTCKMTIANPGNGFIPDIPIFITVGTWVISGNILKVTAVSCQSMDSTVHTLKTIPCDSSLMGGSRDIPINISGNTWTYTDASLNVTISAVKQ